jgi:hypothetical protein
MKTNFEKRIIADKKFIWRYSLQTKLNMVFIKIIAYDKTST